MSISTDEREKLWTEFLERWTLERLNDMTLEEYSQAGDQNCFTYWLERTTEELGSINGGKKSGTAFKFGIYSRDPEKKKDKKSNKTYAYTDDYAWYTPHGTSPDEVFVKVKGRIIDIAKEARGGQFDLIDQKSFGLWPAIKLKIAFLYQNRDAVMIAPIYSRPTLQKVLNSKTKRPSELQRLLIDKWQLPEYGKSEGSVFDFADAVLSQVKS